MLHLFYYSINHYWIYLSVIHKRRKKSLIIQKNCIRETELWDEPGTQIDVPGFL